MPYIAPNVALLIFALQHWNGMPLNTDSWGYWQGAGSLLDGYGYTYFSGNPIFQWPPLYSIYLAGWAAIFGLNGWSLILASGALVTLQAWLWCTVNLLTWNESEGTASRLASFVVAVFVGCYVALNNGSIRANALQLTFLPMLVLATWKLGNANGSVHLSVWTAIAILSASGALLSHSSSIVFIAASAILVFAAAPRDLRRLVPLALIACLPLFVWLVVQRRLGQNVISDVHGTSFRVGSHVFGFGVGHYTALETAEQAVRAVGKLVVPDRLGSPFIAVFGGAVLLYVLIHTHASKRALLFGAVFASVSVLGLYALFNMTWIYSYLSTHYLLFFPLLVVPPLILATHRYEASVFGALILIVLAPQFYWSTKWIIINSGRNLDTLFVTPNTWISRQYLDGPPIKFANGYLISPMKWEEIPGTTY